MSSPPISGNEALFGQMSAVGQLSVGKLEQSLCNGPAVRSPEAAGDAGEHGGKAANRRSDRSSDMSASDLERAKAGFGSARRVRRTERYRSRTHALVNPRGRPCSCLSVDGRRRTAICLTDEYKGASDAAVRGDADRAETAQDSSPTRHRSQGTPRCHQSALLCEFGVPWTMSHSGSNWTKFSSHKLSSWLSSAARPGYGTSA